MPTVIVPCRDCDLPAAVHDPERRTLTVRCRHHGERHDHVFTVADLCTMFGLVDPKEMARNAPDHAHTR